MRLVIKLPYHRLTLYKRINEQATQEAGEPEYRNIILDYASNNIFLRDAIFGENTTLRAAAKNLADQFWKGRAAKKTLRELIGRGSQPELYERAERLDSIIKSDQAYLRDELNRRDRVR